MSTQHPPGVFVQQMRQPIVFDGTATPVKSALFLIICAAWLLPGLTGHDPWKPDEAAAFGVILSMLRDGNWLIPQIAGVPTTDYPPLYYWSAALSAKIFSGLFALHDGARLASGAWMALTILFLHKTATRLLDPRAGRISVILLIGSLGLLVRAHEINPELAGLAGISIALYGLTRLRYDARRGGIVMGIGMGIVALSVGIVPALSVPLMALTMMAVLRDWQNRSLRRGIGWIFVIGGMLASAYPLAFMWFNGESPSDEFWARGIVAWPWVGAVDRELIDVTYYLRILPWYALPTLPFALWIWHKDRHKLRERIELALPASACLVLLAATSLFREARDAHAMVFLLPLALAAASAMDRLPRGWARFIDSLSLLFCGLIIVSAWFYWAAALAGAPEAALRAVNRQFPGFTFQFNLVSFLVAAIFCILWIYAVARAHRNNRRAVVNWTAGITLIWVTANFLALPAVDHVRSYRATVLTIMTMLPSTRNCVQGSQLGDAQRAMLDYYAGIRVVEVQPDDMPRCDWALTQGTRSSGVALRGDWTPVWEGARPGDNFERLRLYRLSSDPLPVR